MRRTVFNEDHEAFRETIRAFIEAEVVPVYDEWFAAGQAPRDFYYKLAELGVRRQRRRFAALDLVLRVVVVGRLVWGHGTSPCRHQRSGRRHVACGRLTDLRRRPDHRAGDAVARRAAGLRDVVVGVAVDDEGRAVLVEDGVVGSRGQQAEADEGGLHVGDGRAAVAEAVRERRPAIPVLFITGYAGTELPPGSEVIDKPFDLDVLARRVQAALTGQ